MLEEPALRTARQPGGDIGPSGHDAGAAVDIDGPARDTVSEGRGEIGAGVANVHDVDQLAQWRLFRRLVQQKLEVFQTRRGPRLEWARRDRVYPDAPWPQLVGEVAAGGLECGLDRPHEVVVRHDAVGAVVAHGE